MGIAVLVAALALSAPASASAGGPRVLQQPGAALSAPARGDAAAVALRFVRERRASLGLRAADLDALGAPSRRTVGGVTMLRWRQAVDGIPSADSSLRVNVASDGRVLSVLGAPASGLSGVDTTPAVSAGAALRAVQDRVGVYRPLVRSGAARGATQATDYEDGSTAALRLFRERLAWRVLYHASSTEIYDAFVDAESGKVLRRVNLVRNAVPVQVWENHPSMATGGGAQRVEIGLTSESGERRWLSSTSQLIGPNAWAYADVGDNADVYAGNYGTSEQVVPGAYSFVAAPNGIGCTSLPCSWTGAQNTPSSWRTNLQQATVQAFYYVNRFHDWLASAPISFEHPFEGAERLHLQTFDGANTGPNGDHVNNANMFTPPVGYPPVMQMYLWNGRGFRSMNGADDASIVYHEYTHGLSSRLITDADGWAALNSPQAGAMGEGWSDWYAKDYLVANGFAVDAPNAVDVEMGGYTDATAHTLRSEAMDCTVGAAASVCPGDGTAGSGGYTYGDFGKIFGTPEVHADGEIWAQTLWELRGAIGSSEARRLITQAMRLSPEEPSFLDERNAILEADAASGGTHRDQIWAVFARRGMGYYAASGDGYDIDPVEDFTLPPGPDAPRGTLAGTVRDMSGAAVAGARIALGAEFARTDADGRFTLSIPVGSYTSVRATAPGYDRAVWAARIVAGATTEASVTLRRNWAASSGGAAVTGNGEFVELGCGPLAATDQTQSSTWSTDVTVGPTMKQLTVTLPEAISVDHFELDPAEGCTDPPASATSSVTIETSVDGTWTSPATTRAFTSADRGRMNVVTPAAAATGVRFVRVTLLSSLGSSDYRDLTEFAVYSNGPAPAPVVTAPPEPTPTPTAGVSTPPPPASTAVPTPVPTAVPTATPTPTPRPSTRPSFTLRASGKRSIRVTARCPKRCTVRATLTVDRATARRLGLGRSRTAASVRRTLRAGTTTFTVKLSSRVKIRRVARFRGTLTVKSGSVTARRKVTVTR